MGSSLRGKRANPRLEPVRESSLERAAGMEGEHEIEDTGLVLEVEDRHHARVLEGGKRAGLAEEATRIVGAIPHLRAQDFDRDDATELRVKGPIHDPIGALA